MPKRKMTKQNDPLPREALEIIATRLRLISDATRLELLQFLANDEKTVQELSGLMGMSQANISKHLSSLADNGILGRRKQGLYVYYSVVDTSIFEICNLVRSALSERFAKVQKHFQ